MNSILEEHLIIAKGTCGTSTGLDLLKLNHSPEHHYAANTYLVALAYIAELEARLTKRPPDGAKAARKKRSVSGKRSAGTPRR